MSSFALTLTWTDNSSNESGFYIERSLAPAGVWSQIASVGVNATKYTDTSGLCGIGYRYRVRAYNQAGASAYSNIAGPASTPCSTPTFQLSSSLKSRTFSAAGGTSTVIVNPSCACGWTATSPVSWITITAGASGIGTGTATYAVASNLNDGARSSTLTVAGYPLTITQAGAGNLPALWQVQYFGVNNPKCAPNVDADGTSQNNLFKYVAGLDPTNPASVFVLNISNVPGQPNQKRLAFGPWAPGRIYRVKCRTNPASGTYGPVTSISAPQTNGNQIIVTDLNAIGNTKFYRVHVQLP